MDLVKVNFVIGDDSRVYGIRLKPSSTGSSSTDMVIAAVVFVGGVQ